MATKTQDRYDTKIEIRKTVDGKTVYRSLRPKTIASNVATDVQILATDATRMDKVAQDVFGSSQYWWKIAAANKQVDGSLYFPPGTKIIIPVGR